ncbi:MAG: hypothetical protein IJR91_04280 [Ruminococcus sp.]|nr:hypothetical protein [Ruminococcus sp.]
MFYLRGYTEKQLMIIGIVACVVSVIAAIVLGFVGRFIVKGKGYPDQMNHGFAWGFWLGIIGLIVCACKQPYNAQPFNGQFFNGQPYGGQPYNGQPYNGQPYNGQPYNGQPYGGQPYGGQPYNGQPYNGQPYSGQQPYNGQPAADSWQCSCGAMNGFNETICHVCGAPRQNGSQS